MDQNLIKPTKIKSAVCSICRKVPTSHCDWRQGRCPHITSLADQIINNPYKARFYNLIKFFSKKK
jgi:hypothetical protein